MHGPLAKVRRVSLNIWWSSVERIEPCNALQCSMQVLHGPLPDVAPLSSVSLILLPFVSLPCYSLLFFRCCIFVVILVIVFIFVVIVVVIIVVVIVIDVNVLQ